MKLLFVYGTKVKKDNLGNYYVGGTLPTDIWKNRYGFISNDITFVGFDDGFCGVNDISKMNLIDDNVKFVGIKYRLNNLKNFLSFKVNNEIHKIISSEVKKCDLVIARVPDLYSYYAIDCALKYKKKIIVEVVGCAWDSLWNHSLIGKFAALPLFLKMRSYVKKSPNVIYVSNTFLQKRYPTNGKWISCSDVSLNKPCSCNKSFNDKKIILGTCAAVDVAYKGQKYVLDAISSLKEVGITNIEYQLVGGGDPNYLFEYAKKLNISDCVNFLGQIPHDSIFDWFNNIDIYVQPSNQEGLCRAVVEAMSMGCPCIVSSAGGNPELIDSKYVFKKKNVSDLKNKILSMTRSEMQEQSRINFNKSKNYELSLLDKKRNDFYLEVVNRKV